MNFLGGYYTIEQTKSRLRIIVLNTNFMRHDSKYSQSNSAPVRQRPDGSYVLGQVNNKDYHRKHHHRDNEDYNNNNNYYRYNKERIHSSHSNSDFQNGDRVGSASDNEGIVSALSVTHESEKQWQWFEEVLAKSSRNKETVSENFIINFKQRRICSKHT